MLSNPLGRTWQQAGIARMDPSHRSTAFSYDARAAVPSRVAIDLLDLRDVGRMDAVAPGSRLPICAAFKAGAAVYDTEAYSHDAEHCGTEEQQAEHGPVDAEQFELAPKQSGDKFHSPNYREDADEARVGLSSATPAKFSSAFMI
ncbi:hypothetical protein [Acidovorax sp. CF316]|uniref:hypothetical protein n=1 Tax=Acidovorax sp. CF316 TaxID=1144317 RepID=UPI0011B24C40|nr:hypothetical protein [Acidovorax sp. CF316]